MSDHAIRSGSDACGHSAEIRRLNKIISALMDRAERTASATTQGSEYGEFQATIILEEQVRRRTAELEAALRENEKMTRALRESEAKFRGVVGQSMVGIVIIEDGKFSYSNAKADEIFGYAAGEMRQLGPLDTAVEGDRAIVAENLRRRLSGRGEGVDYTFHGLRKDGTVIDVECHGSGVDVGGTPLLVSLVMDVTERTRAERELRALHERLRERSTRDALTGVYNRCYLEEILERELVRSNREGRPLSIIMADLDLFKAVNDRLGHQAGDKVLRTFGALLAQRARASDVCCRYGGEEFVVVMPGIPADVAFVRAEQLRRAIEAARISYHGSVIEVTASFGVAASPEHGRTVDELVASADRALYAAKAAGRNRVVAGCV